MPQPFRYILRYMIDDGFDPQPRIEELVALCREARIEEVMLFLTPEELTTGHPTDEEVERFIVLAREVKRRLADAGVAMSLNPWTTTFHVSRGRRLRPGQDFHVMVGETGAVSPISACPLCPAWQTWLAATFARLAQAIQPTAIWVEDDWRLHNHEPDMAWGGCFCQLHLDRFAALVGERVTREELLAKVLAPGPPHPWRDAWLRVWRDSLIEPAARLRDTVQNAAPGVRLGLMSSVPDVHSAEGRDWAALADALGREPAFLVRPHVAPYTEVWALPAVPSMTRHTLANLPRPLEIYPELENSPRCGQYSKSHRFSIWECLHAALYGSHGITINHYDMMGNGVALDRGFGGALADAKPRLNALTELGIDDADAQGVAVLFHPDVSRHLHAQPNRGVHGLVQPSVLWADTLSILGVSHGYRSTVMRRSGEPIAVSGQTLRAFSDDGLRELLAGPTLLDALSVEVLLERGFGDWIGVERAQWTTLTDTAFAYEAIDEADPAVFGLPHPRMTAQRCANRLLAMSSSPQTSVRTTIRTADHRPLMPGLTVYSNAAGGRVACVAYPLEPGNQFFMGFFNVFRRTLLQRLFAELAPEAPGAMLENGVGQVYRVPTSRGLALAILNPLADPLVNPTLVLPAGAVDLATLRRLNVDGSWSPADAVDGGTVSPQRITLRETVAPLDALVLLNENLDRSGP